MAAAESPNVHTDLDSNSLWLNVSKAIDDLHENQQPTPLQFMQLYT